MRKASAAVLSLMLALCAACSPGAGSATLPPETPTQRATDGVAATDVPTLTPTPTQTVVAIMLPGRTGTPFTFPQAVAPASECSGAPPTSLIVHERGQVTNDDPQPLNVRDQPGLSGEIVGVLRSLDIFYVADGPRCADDYTWFRIRAGRIEGWIAEGEPGLYYVAPYLQ